MGSSISPKELAKRIKRGEAWTVPEPSAARIAELEKRVRELELENSILRDKEWMYDQLCK